MQRTRVIFVRIYLNDGSHQLDNLVKRLHDWEKLRGLSVFRGIAGYGDSGRVHVAKLIDLSVELPVVVEFFDTPERVETVLEHLGDSIKPGHLVSWEAWVNE